jgi:hypothetical protein
MMDLRLTERGATCRLSLGDIVHGDGRTLQEAADALVSRVLGLVLGHRSGAWAPRDPQARAFVTELDEMIARGEDIRPRLFG